jgi:hypothetical protein
LENKREGRQGLTQNLEELLFGQKTISLGGQQRKAKTSYSVDGNRQTLRRIPHNLIFSGKLGWIEKMLLVGK